MPAIVLMPLPKENAYIAINTSWMTVPNASRLPS
jgi:hypothetical protein